MFRKKMSEMEKKEKMRELARELTEKCRTYYELNKEAEDCVNKFLSNLVNGSFEEINNKLETGWYNTGEKRALQKEFKSYGCEYKKARKIIKERNKMVKGFSKRLVYESLDLRETLNDDYEPSKVFDIAMEQCGERCSESEMLFFKGVLYANYAVYYGAERHSNIRLYDANGMICGISSSVQGEDSLKEMANICRITKKTVEKNIFDFGIVFVN